MSDPLEVTARDLIRYAEQERDLHIGRATLLEREVESLKQEIQSLISELKPAGPVPEQRSEFANRLVDYIWRSVENSVHEDDPPDIKDRIKAWLAYRLEKWSENP